MRTIPDKQLRFPNGAHGAPYPISYQDALIFSIPSM